MWIMLAEASLALNTRMISQRLRILPWLTQVSSKLIIFFSVRVIARWMMRFYVKSHSKRLSHGNCRCVGLNALYWDKKIFSWYLKRMCGKLWEKSRKICDIFKILYWFQIFIRFLKFFIRFQNFLYDFEFFYTI